MTTTFRHLILTVILAYASGIAAVAQQDAMFTQYMHNELTINPAYAGSQQAGSITALYRNQWSGMPGAPKSFSLNAHTPTAIQGEKVGLGISLLNDKIGNSEQLRFFGIYTYRIALGQKSHLQLGLQAGINYLESDLRVLNPKNPDDVNFSGSGISSLKVNFGTGIFFFTDKLYAGLSVPQLVNNKTRHNGVQLAKQSRHLFFTSGYVFDITYGLKFKPSVMFKYTHAAPPSVDISGNLIIQQVLWAGCSWRSADAVNLLLGVQGSKQLYIGYAYDFATTKLGDYHDGSHEIMVNYRFDFSSNRVLTPRFF